MKRIGKLLAVLMTLTFVLGTGTAVLAAGEPSETDTETVTVYGVEEGVTVTAYHIISATYDSKGNGLTGYVLADGVSIENIESPTAEEITTIARQINNGTLTITDTAVLTYQSDGTYTAGLTAGMWIILVSNANATIYNPMIVSNWYKDANDADSLQPGAVDADGNFVEGSWGTGDDEYTYSGTSVYAKKTTTTIDKQILDPVYGNSYGTNGNIGDEVTFEITTTIPDYSDAYDDDTVQFIITDTLSAGLEAISAEDLTIKVGGKKYAKEATNSDGEVVENYTITTSPSESQVQDGESQTVTISFGSAFVMAHTNDEVVITYTTTIDDDAVLAEEGPNINQVYLIYTNEYTVNGTASYTTTDIIYNYVYTFALTDEFVKVSPGGTASAEGSTVTVTNALAGAQFTVYTDAACSVIYTNDIFSGTAESDENGYVCVEGLSEGTYYLTETQAPDGYYINDTVYQLVITTKFNDDGTLDSYTIVMCEAGDASSERTSAYTLTYTDSVTQTSTAAVEATAVVNNVRQKLPDTGDIGTSVFVLLSVSILALSVLLLCRRKRPVR